MDFPDSKVGEIIKNFELVRYLGKGGFGTVYKAVVITPCSFSPLNVGDEVAIKMINRSSLKEKKKYEMMRNEIEILSISNHPSIIKLYGRFEDDHYVYLILELCHKGDLHTYLKSSGKFEEAYARHFFRQILQAIIYLHSKHIMHRDLKTANLLLDDKMNIKICDFGMAVQLRDENDKHKTMCGTTNYISPEIVKGQEYGLEVDVWCLGIILYNFVIGRLPFDSDKNKEILSNIRKADIVVPLNSKLSDNLKDLLGSMILKDQEKRIKVHEILNHPFLLNQNKNQPKPSKSIDSGLASIGTLSSSKASNSTGRKFHSEEVPWGGNTTYNSQRVCAGNDDTDTSKNTFPRFGKPIKLNTNNLEQKTHRIGSLKKKIQVLPSLKEVGFNDQSFEAEIDSHCTCGNGLNECNRHPKLECYRQPNLPLHRDCDGNSRSCDGARGVKACRSISPHNSHGAVDSGVCSRSCKRSNKSCCTHGEQCERRNCSCKNEAKTDNNCCHRSISSVPCTHSSREDGDFRHCHQQGTTCSHFGHCLTAHCVHQKSCSCKQESYINHESCTHDCQQKNKVCNTLNCKNVVLSSDYKAHNAAKQETENVLHSPPSDISKKPQIFNTKYLKPRSNASRFHRYSILIEGDVCVETFDKKEKKYVLNVYIISSDGMKVTVYKFRRRQRVRLKDTPPSILENSNCEVFHYENLPRKHWSIYSHASTYVRHVKEMTPRILIYSSEAKAILFQSMVDFEATFYNGEGHRGGKFLKHLEKVEFIDGTNRIQIIGLNAIDLGDDIKKMWTLALELEKKCKLISDFVESTCDGLFPVCIGSKPAQICTPLKNNNKENIHLTSPQQNSALVTGGRAPPSSGHPLTSRENYNHSKVSSKNMYSSILQSTKGSNTIHNSMSKAVEKKTDKGHFLYDENDRIFFAKLQDGSEFVHRPGSTFFHFSDHRGHKSCKYNFDSSDIPLHVIEKVKVVHGVMKNDFSEYLNSSQFL